MRKLLFGVLVIISTSCNKGSNPELTFDDTKDAKLVSRLKQAYGLTTFNVAATDEQKTAVLQAVSSRPIFAKVRDELNLATMRIFQNAVENVTVAQVTFTTTPNKVYAVKGAFVKGIFVAQSELLAGKKITEKGNGKVVILKDNEGLIVTAQNGQETITSLDQKDAEWKLQQVKDCAGRHGGTGFCQREPNESFSTCYKAEKDEFCDGFFTCLAVDTQVSVMLVIAASCECSATQCPK